MSNTFIGPCPACGSGEIHEQAEELKCTGCSFKISRTLSRHVLSREEVEALILTGRTNYINFISRNGKAFKAALVIKDKKLVYEFDNSKKHSEYSPIAGSTSTEAAPPGRVDVRVEAFSSGSVSIHVLCGGKVIKREISFGNISAREAECLGSITAVNLIKWLLKEVDDRDIHLSVNNIDFVGYLLREARPKDIQMRLLVSHLWERLSQFKSWQVVYLHRRSRKLEGSNSGRFPKGVFPYVTCNTEVQGNSMTIRLSQSPEILTQFKASFPNASLEDLETEKVYYLPSGAVKAVEAWLRSVKEVE